MKNKLIILAVCVVIVVLVAYFLRNSVLDTAETSQVQRQSVHGDSDFDSDSRYGGSLSGRVIDGPSQRGLAAIVSLMESNGQSQTVTCSSDGSYQFGIDNRKYSVSATYDGYVARGKNDVSHSIELEDGEDTFVQDIELWPEARLIGRITNDGAGFPADVKLSYVEDASGARNYDFEALTAGDNGDFSFDMAYAGTAKLVITAKGFPEQTLSDIVLESGKTVDLGEIPMLHGVSLYGSVLDINTKQPIPNAVLQFVENDDVISEATSDENGEYQFPAVIKDEVRVKTLASGYHDVDSAVAFKAASRQEYNVYMTPIEGVSLVLNNMTGREPLISTVTATDVKTDKIVYKQDLENGTYDLKQLTDGPYIFTAVSADGETSASARVASGKTVTLTLKPFGTINVQLVIDTPNPKYDRAEYRYTYESGDNETFVSDWSKPLSDSFTLENLKPGTYTIDARANFYFTHVSTSRPVYIDMGRTEFVKLKLTERKSVRFQFKNASDIDLSKCRFVIINTESKGIDLTTSSFSHGFSEGEGYTFEEALPPGNFTFVVESADGRVGAFYGSSKGDDSDISMELDMSSSRKMTSDGNSLSFDVLFNRKQPDENASPEEIMEAEKEQFNSIKKWMNDVDEQAQWQINSAKQQETPDQEWDG